MHRLAADAYQHAMRSYDEDPLSQRLGTYQLHIDAKLH